jgi:hypothetical protein
MQMFAENDVDDLTLTQMATSVEQSILESQATGDEPDPTDPTNTETGFDDFNVTSAVQDGDISTLDPEDDIATSHVNQVQTDLSDDDGGVRNDKFPVILLTAPTGKAANHLGKKSHLPSFTIHQVIYSYWNWKKNNDEENKSEWKFSKVQALVVDEC